MSVQDLMWVIVKKHNNKVYILVTVDGSGVKKWTLDITMCRMFVSLHRADMFINDHFKSFSKNEASIIRAGDL